jgi:hypothetical protein
MKRTTNIFSLLEAFLSFGPCKRGCFLIAFVIFFGDVMVSKVNAQVVWNTASTGSVNVLACGDVPTTITVGMTNISGSTIADGQMILDLPPGLLYVPGILTSVSGPAVSESDINNLNAPVISVGDLAAGQTVDFTFGVKTFDCTTYNHVVGGAITKCIYL